MEVLSRCPELGCDDVAARLLSRAINQLWGERHVSPRGMRRSSGRHSVTRIFVALRIPSICASIWPQFVP